MHKEEWEYVQYTTPQRLDRELHTLEGIIKGIAIDNSITNAEVDALSGWCSRHELVCNKSPYNEIIPHLQQALKDGIIDPEEKEDLLWLCKRYITPNKYYDSITADMQRLQGVLAGIVADNIITEDELKELRNWLNNHDHLRSMWPYDEIDSLITDVMSDGKIDEDEHTILLNFCSQFLKDFTGVVIDLPNDDEFLLTGVVSAAPEIIFEEKLFCFTGTPDRGPKRILAQEIVNLGGQAVSNLNFSTDYLVVGAKGSDCWAFSCYGRKVEKAMNLRKEGLTIQIVHEFDFWDAVEDAK